MHIKPKWAGPIGAKSHLLGWMWGMTSHGSATLKEEKILVGICNNVQVVLYSPLWIQVYTGFLSRSIDMAIAWSQVCAALFTMTPQNSAFVFS